jgi:hypothetical protein
MPGLGWPIGEYDLQRAIANGRFGTVYEAVSATRGTVAIKLIPSSEGREKIEAERRGALLQQQFGAIHDDVPKVYECRDFETFFGIVMELVQAPQLSAVIARGALPERLAVQYARAICEFLDRAHRFETVIDHEPYHRIVHADLKPDHILIPGPERIKVLDFGIAKALAKTTVVTTNNWGTRAYASPERLESGHVNEHVDLWSLGVMLYEMVSGHRPYRTLEHDASALERAIRTNTPREALPNSVQRGLAAIIDKLLAGQSEHRYQSAAEIAQDLDAFLRHESPRAEGRYVTTDTVRITAGPATGAYPSSISTEPIPASPIGSAAAANHGARAGVVPPAGSPAASLPATARGRSPVLRRMARVAALLVSTSLFTTECVAWFGAERMRAELSSLDGVAVAPKRREYDRLRRWSLVDIGARLRLDAPLKQRLVAVADGVITDYRQEEPTVAEAQWRQATEALKWAAALTPDDTSLAPKEQDCEGHVDRIAAQNRKRTSQADALRLFKQAIDKFRRSARLDPRSPDPYLGLSRVYIYGLGDVDQGAVAIREAEARGHPPGWRERAQLGDGYLGRAEKIRREAPKEPGPARREAIEMARDDYARCVESFNPILGKGNAKGNRDACQRHLDAANDELGEPFGKGR